MYEFFSQYGYLIEWAGIITSLAYVICNIRQQVMSWYFGLACYLLYAAIFFHAHLYASALLSMVSTLFMLYGWYKWKWTGAVDTLPVTLCNRIDFITFSLVAALLTVLVHELLLLFEGARYVWGDATIAGTSFVALYAAARKKLETWYFWIGINAFAVVVYYISDLQNTAALYCLFLVCSFFGLREWRKNLSMRTLPVEAA